MNTYKVLFLGEGGVGKTNFLNVISGSAFEPRYIASLGAGVVPVKRKNDRGENEVFNVWDCAGREKFKGLGDGYFVGAQAAVFFFDLTQRYSLKNLGFWIRDCKRVTGNIPFVVVATKCDIAKKVITDEEITQFFKEIPVIRISSKNNVNIDEPLRVLSQKLREQ